MEKVKIYISKSKVGNPDDLMQVRHHLSKLDVEILEYTGGSYTPKLLLSADILIVVPPSLDNGIVGKGQYTEVGTFDGKSMNGEPVYLVCGVNSITIQLANIEDYQETSKGDWKSNYGDLQINDNGVTMGLKQLAELHGLERKSNQPYTGHGPMLAASKL